MPNPHYVRDRDEILQEIDMRNKELKQLSEDASRDDEDVLAALAIQHELRQFFDGRSYSPETIDRNIAKLRATEDWRDQLPPYFLRGGRMAAREKPSGVVDDLFDAVGEIYVMVTETAVIYESSIERVQLAITELRTLRNSIPPCIPIQTWSRHGPNPAVL